ncbi:serine-rich adhesin for platelets-like [Littorina saxatilis]|uniref:serine-rich adhesin for platelets-like n=1 Tax=Littorina saxatilis TaxID=31220 RepID=UPI0038B5F75C
MKRFVRMDPRLSRSMPLLQPPGCSFPLIYRVISPRWPERRMYTPRHYYINGVRTKLIGADSYSNPTRSPKRLILCGASGPHAGKITRSSSTAELSRAGVYCSTEDLRDHGRVSRRAASCEDVYRTTSIPGTPGWDSRFSESGVSLNDSRTTLGSLVGTEDVDGVSQCSFGSSSAFHEVTNDSELDRPDSDSFSVQGSLCGHDRALDVVHEGDGPYSCFGADRTAHRKTRHDSGSGRSSPDDRREFYHSTPTKRGSPVLSIFPGEEEDLHFPSHVSNDSLHPDSSYLSRDSLPSPMSPRSPSSPSASQRKEKAGTKTGRQDDSNNYRSAESIPVSVDTTRRALDRKRRDFFSSLQDCSKLEEQSPGESVQSWITTGHTQRRSAFTDPKSLISNEDSPRQQEVLRSSGSAARTSVSERVAAIEQGPSLKIPADKDGHQKVLEEREKRSRDSEGVNKKPSDYNEGVESDDTNKQASEGSPRLQTERRIRENGTKTLAPTVAAASEGGGAGLLSSRQLYQAAPETASSRESTESGGGGEQLSDFQKNTQLPRSSTHYSDGLSEGVTGKKGENINNEGRKDRVNEAENRLKLLTTPSNDETVLLSTVSTDGTVPTSSPSSSKLFASSGYCSAVSDVDGSIDGGVNDNTHPLSTAVVTDGDVSVACHETTNISPESDWKTNRAGVTDSEINIVGTSDNETATVTDGEISSAGLSNAGGASDWKTSNTAATNTGETHNITTITDSGENFSGVTGVADSVNNSRESDSIEQTSPGTDTENTTVYESDKNTAEGKTRVAGAVGPQTSSDNYNNSTTALDNYTTSTGVDDREGYRTSDLHSDSRGVNDSWLQKGREEGEIGESEGGEELGGAGKRSNQHATQLALVSQVTTHPSTSLRQDKNTRDGASPTPSSTTTTTTQAFHSSPTPTTDSVYSTTTPTTVTSSSVDSVPTPTLTTDTHFSTATPTDLDYSETTPTTDSGYSSTATSSTLPHASCEQQVECFSEGVNTHISTERSQQDFLNQNPTVAATEGEMERCPAAERRFVDRSEQHLPPTTSTREVSHRHRRHVRRLTTVEKTVTTEHTVRHRDHNDTSSSPSALGEGGSVNNTGVGLPPASCDFLTTTTDRTVSTTVREEDSEREETTTRTTSPSTLQQPLIPGGRSSEEAGYHQPRPHSSNIASVEVTATATTKGETVTPATSSSTSTHLYLQPATQQQRQQTGYREGKESTPEMAGSGPVNTSYNNILDSLQEQLSLLSSEDVSFTSGYGSPRNSSQVWEYRDHAEATLPTTQRNSDRAYSDAEDKSDRVEGTSSVSFTLNRSYADRNSGKQQRAQIPESTSTSVDGQSVTDSKTDYLPSHGSSTFEADRGDSDLRHARASQRLSTSWGEEALSTEDGGRGGEGSGNENRTLPPSFFSQRSNTSLWRRPTSSSSSELDDSDGNYSSISTTDSSRHHHGPHSESDFPPSDGPEDYDNIHSFNDFVSGLKGQSTSDQPSLHHSMDMVAHDLRGSGFLRASVIQETILEADDESETADDEANTTGDTTLSSFKSSVHFSVPQSTPKMNYVSPMPQIKLWSTDQNVSELTASEDRREFSTPSPIHPLQDLSDRLSNISADLSYDLSCTMHDDSRLDLDLSYSRHSACSSPTPSDVSEGSVYSTSATAEVRKQAELGTSFKSAELAPTHRVARRNLSSAFSAKTPSKSKKSQWVEEKIVLFQKLLNDFEWQSKTSEQRLLDDMISFETRGDNAQEDVTQKNGEICDDLYRAFTRENQELRQNHVCPVIEDHMPAIRFKRFLRKKHNSKLKDNRTFRIRHRLDRLAEAVSQSGGGKSVSEMDLSRLRSTPYSSYQSKLLSPSALRDRFGSDVFTDDTDVKKSFSSDSAYSTLSSATSRHISDLDSTYRSVCDSRGDVSSIATDVSMDENDKLRSLSDVFEQLDVCEDKIDSALLDRLQVGHYKADTL